MKRVLLCAAVALCSSACGDDENNNEDSEGREVEGPTALSGEMLAYPDIWSASVDTYGSSFQGTDPLVKDGKVDITFTIAKMESADAWPYAELICKPGVSLASLKAVTIRYQSEVKLAIKLSQKDFGFEGDQSYAHYQHELEASDEVVTRTLKVADFAQPSWATEESRRIPLKLANVDAIYVVPLLDYAQGETGRFVLDSFVLED